MSAKQVRGFTVDDASTRDIDDAIWVEKSTAGWTVLVSIADVARAVAIGSENDVRARAMVTTKYFARGNSPMLPRELSEDELSLWPHRPRRTLTVEIHVPEDLGEPTFSIYRSRLISQAKLSYRMVSQALDPGLVPSDESGRVIIGVVRTAIDLSVRLLEQRRKSGAMALYDLNNGWITTEEGWLRQIEDHREAMGQIVVQEMMILANTCVARWAVANDVPVPFRNHTARPAAPARAELMRQLDEAMLTPVVDIDVVRERVHMLLDKADYGAALLGHFGLNLPAYVHFTSPIRRYADSVLHRQVRAKLKGEPLPYSREQIEEVCLHINSTLRVEDAELKQRAKDKATTRAKRVTSARQLSGLFAKDFERVCKTWARSTEETPEELVEAFRLRIADGTVPTICVAVAFAEAADVPAWRQIRQALLDSLAGKPQDAVSLLTMAHQMGFWTVPVLSTEQSGPSHAPVFCTTASWTIADGDTLHVTHQGASKKRVEQEIATLLIAQRFKLDHPSFRDAPTSASHAPTVTVKKGFVFDMTKDPISLLMEYCQAHKIGLATFAFEQSGPAHLPSITCSVACADKQATARASNKQEAKRAAAVAILSQLAPASTTSTREALS